jgi:hypothetical protein
MRTGIAIALAGARHHNTETDKGRLVSNERVLINTGRIGYRL